MWTVSEVAARDGVSKQAVSKKVKALADKHGLSVERNGQGHVVRLNVAEYDHLRSRFGDPSKDQRPLFDGAAGTLPTGAKAAEPEKPNESYDEALRQKTWHEAEKRRLELAELKGDLVRVAAVVDAVVRCNEEITRIVDRLPSATDDLAAAVARDGAHGLRVELRKLATRIRDEIGDAMEAVAAGRAGEREDRAA